MHKRPNILFFFTDDQRFDAAGCLGTPALRTPHLDAFADRATVFNRAHIPGGTSGAVCMPSRAMVHTGRTLFHLDDCGQEIPEEHTTLGECLARAGYQTFGTGKWHNGRAAYARSFETGGEIMFGGMADHWNVPCYDFDPSGRYDRRCPSVPDPFHSNRLQWRDGCDHVHAGRHSTDLIAGAAADFLRSRDSARPFLCYVSLLAPHDPRTMPEEYLRLYDPASIELPPNFREVPAVDTGALQVRDELLATQPRRPDEIRRHIAEYYGMISHLDAAFGRLLATLDATGQADDTIVVVAGDNGLALGQHGLMGKQSLYDHSVRIPLMIAGPGVPKGQRTDAWAYLLDIFPTLCDLTGVPVPDSVDGRSLVPCLEDPGATVREALYLAYCDTLRGVRRDRWKLIESVAGDGATELYDLAADPWEQRNLAAEPGRAQILTDLRGELVRLRDAWDDREHPLSRRFWTAYEARNAPAGAGS